MAEKVQQKQEFQGKLPDNVVFVGTKPSMAYVLGVVTQLANNNGEVYIKARGRSISKAVDVAEIVRRRFAQNTKVSKIEIGTEEREVENGQKINVSTINIVLSK